MKQIIYGTEHKFEVFMAKCKINVWTIFLGQERGITLNTDDAAFSKVAKQLTAHFFNIFHCFALQAQPLSLACCCRCCHECEGKLFHYQKFMGTPLGQVRIRQS